MLIRERLGVGDIKGEFEYRRAPSCARRKGALSAEVDRGVDVADKRWSSEGAGLIERSVAGMEGRRSMLMPELRLEPVVLGSMARGERFRDGSSDR